MDVYSESTIQYSPYTALIAYPPTTWHKSTFFKIMYVVDRDIEIKIKSRLNNSQEKTMRIFCGDALIITPDDTHKYEHLDKSIPYTHRDVYIFDERMREICALFSPSLYTEITSPEYPILFHLSQNAVNMLEETTAFLNIKTQTPQLDQVHFMAVTMLLGSLVTQKIATSIYPKWINELIQNLNQERFMTLDLEEIVASTNYSHGYVCREFHKFIGKTLKQYINETKIDYSRALLMNKDYTLETIALRLGFGSQSNYINLFRLKLHITPNEWRKQHLNSADLYPNILWGKYLKTD